MKPSIEQTALRLLARREHSAQELRRKLHDKGYPGNEVDALLERLARDKLLSDERFMESFIHVRTAKGHGPLLIRAELEARGVARTLIADAIAVSAPHWREAARRVRHKRFGAAPRDQRERVRQMRFLQQRGFTAEQISAAFKSDDTD
ncbi:MAG: regulatory protein RecX [Pseudomonadota bacterium]